MGKSNGCPVCNQEEMIDLVEGEKRKLEVIIQNIGKVLYPTSATYLMEKTDFDRVMPYSFTPEEVLNMAMSSRHGAYCASVAVGNALGQLAPKVTQEISS